MLLKSVFPSIKETHILVDRAQPGLLMTALTYSRKFIMFCSKRASKPGSGPFRIGILLAQVLGCGGVMAGDPKINI
jgi:hypothetical protein